MNARARGGALVLRCSFFFDIYPYYFVLLAILDTNSVNDIDEHFQAVD